MAPLPLKLSYLISPTASFTPSLKARRPPWRRMAIPSRIYRRHAHQSPRDERLYRDHPAEHPRAMGLY